MGRTALWRSQASACVLLLALVSTACGDQGGGDPAAASESSSPTSQRGGESPTGEPVPPGAPECAEIWADGARIPRGYQGCADQGTYVERESLACSSGQRMVRYGQRYYGVIGGTVHRTAERLIADHEFRDAVRSCRA